MEHYAIEDMARKDVYEKEVRRWYIEKKQPIEIPIPYLDRGMFWTYQVPVDIFVNLNCNDQSYI